MDDIRTLKRAKYFMLAISDGINPANGKLVSKNDTAANREVQKCCSYIAALLDELIQNPPADTPAEQPCFSSSPIGVNELSSIINDALDPDVKKLTGGEIASWLAERGYLDVVTFPDDKTRKTTNSYSYEIGIISSPYTVDGGHSYDRPLYTKKAQQYVWDNIDEIFARRKRPQKE